MYEQVFSSQLSIFKGPELCWKGFSCMYVKSLSLNANLKVHFDEALNPLAPHARGKKVKPGSSTVTRTVSPPLSVSPCQSWPLLSLRLNRVGVGLTTTPRFF